MLHTKPSLPSELIINPDGSIFHLHLKPGEIADQIILVGDPGRAKLIGNYFDTLEVSVESREFVTRTGMYNGKRLTVLSTGIGTDNIDIVLNELDALVNIDFKTRLPKDEKVTLEFTRIGTTGSLQADIPVDSFILSEYAGGFDGLIYYYQSYEKALEKDLTKAFLASAPIAGEYISPYFCKASGSFMDALGKKSVKGITLSAPGFYGPQGRSLRLQSVFTNFINQAADFTYHGYSITNFEMESSAIYGLSHMLGHKAQTICAVIANRKTGEASPDYLQTIEQLISYTLEVISS